MPVSHNPESIAYKISTSAGKSVVYSGDTDYCESLVSLAAGADIFICECSFPDGHKVPGHLTPSLAGKMAAKANPGRLVLTHFYPECEAADLVSQCRSTWKGPLTLAEDLMTFKIS